MDSWLIFKGIFAIKCKEAWCNHRSDQLSAGLPKKLLIVNAARQAFSRAALKAGVLKPGRHW
jgi:hypothetical protein